MVKSAESDIISPSITTEDPLALLSKEILILYKILGRSSVLSFKSCNKLICSSTVSSANCKCIKPLLSNFLNSGSIGLSKLLNFLLQSASRIAF
jgi:hypothetical protein